MGNFETINNIDLNLLLYLDILLEELNISQAASRLHITQPAMSNALARLREVFQDELLLRSGRTMVASPFALQIKLPLKKALEQIRNEVLQQKPFDPETDTFHFKTAFHGYEELLLLPQVFAEIAKYKNLTLHNHHPKKMHTLEELIQGIIHFTSSPFTEEHEGIFRKKFLEDNYVCLAHQDFVLKELDLDTYCLQKHLMITPHGGPGAIDENLQLLRKKRRIQMTVGEFSSAPWILCSDPTLLATVPAKLANKWVEVFPLRIFSLPLSLPPLVLYLSWHHSSQNIPALRWLKEILLSQDHFV